MRAWLLGSLLLASCRAGVEPRDSPAFSRLPPTVRSPSVTVVASAAVLSPEPAASEPAAARPTAAAPAAAASVPATMLIEPLYSALGHPRLATEMQTLERDDELFKWALGGSADAQHPSNRPGFHPATRVVVDVALLSRAPVGSTRRLQRIARSSGYWPLRACFEDAQRGAPRSERSARVRLTLSAAGKVLGSRSLGALPEPGYARCVRERLARLSFAPGFGRKLDVELRVKQWPGDAPVPPRAPGDSVGYRT